LLLSLDAEPIAWTDLHGASHNFDELTKFLGDVLMTV
jgi:hypothetical protein